MQVTCPDRPSWPLHLLFFRARSWLSFMQPLSLPCHLNCPAPFHTVKATLSWHGKGKGRDWGRNKHRKTERKERKCSGGVQAVADTLACLSSLCQHCRLSQTLIKSYFFCAMVLPAQSCLGQSGEGFGGSQEEKDKESIYPFCFSGRHLEILQLS